MSIDNFSFGRVMLGNQKLKCVAVLDEIIILLVLIFQ
jgi:hypothetical protein